MPEILVREEADALQGALPQDIGQAVRNQEGFMWGGRRVVVFPYSVFDDLLFGATLGWASSVTMSAAIFYSKNSLSSLFFPPAIAIVMPAFTSVLGLGTLMSLTSGAAGVLYICLSDETEEDKILETAGKLGIGVGTIASVISGYIRRNCAFATAAPAMQVFGWRDVPIIDPVD